MRQRKSYMKIIIIIIKKKTKRIKSKVLLDGRTEGVEERESFIIFIFLLFLSQIYGNWTVDFHRSRRQSWTTRRELQVGTNILAFCQTLKGRKFSYLYYFELKGYVMA